MFESLLATFAWCAVAMVVFAFAGFALSQVLGRLDVVDVLWGLGFVVAAVVSLEVGAGLGARGVIATGLVLVWGSRLALHIYLRRRGRPEDRRYVYLSSKWGKNRATHSFVQIFLAQAGLALIIVLPVIIVNSTTSLPLNALDFAGIVVWCVGFLFETVGDYQLSRHLANPENKGKLMTTGLWQYTRHPNYFGEVVQWWGIFLLALSVPYGGLGVVGPLLITFLILKVSGVPLLEKHYEGRADWEAYKARTNMFLPWLPRRNV